MVPLIGKLHVQVNRASGEPKQLPHGSDSDPSRLYQIYLITHQTGALPVSVPPRTYIANCSHTALVRSLLLTAYRN